jgi:hypothetical protein
MGQARRFTVTLNNPVCTLEELWHPSLSYLVAAKEIAPQTGTPHFQIYLEVPQKRTEGSVAKSMAKHWGSHPKILISKGTKDQNTVYVLKNAVNPEDWIERGKAMEQGKRSDLDEVGLAIKGGMTLNALCEEYTSAYIKFHAGVEKAYSRLSPNLKSGPKKVFGLNNFPVNWPVDEIQAALGERSVILWGEAGSGKTCLAQTLMPTAIFVTHMDDLLRFDKSQHEGLIFDDMSFHHLPREAQIHVVDCEQDRSIHCRYSCAHIPAETKKIFTTNCHMGQVFLAGDAAINRRIKLFHLNKQPFVDAPAVPEAPNEIPVPLEEIEEPVPLVPVGIEIFDLDGWDLAPAPFNQWW